SFSLLGEQDLYLFNEGSHLRLYEKLGSHPTEINGVAGTVFGVWAPSAEQVFVFGDFNGWNKGSFPLRPRGSSGIWEGFVPGAIQGTRYKYHIVSRHNGYRVDKADPFAVCNEEPPRTASIVWDLPYKWADNDWMSERKKYNSLEAPLAIYEV